MVEPRVIPRDEHTISRRDIDPDALKVLYRLRQANHVAYLVGGSVRDLLLGRRPKDFDIGTSAHPNQVKKLFRNCWIIGRRFRLAHVKFGTKVIEVATFRRQVQAGEEIVQDGVPAPDPATAKGELLLHHDNTFGTPEEDAFRRDFTINALVYDIATFSIIDYVNGLDDLRAGIVRSIGDPHARFQEDPVRMLRAVALSARLDFRIDQPVLDAIGAERHLIAKSAPPRLLEEFYKILRGAYAEKTFRMLAETGLLEPISTELHHAAGDRLWQSLASLDAYRRQFETTPGDAQQRRAARHAARAARVLCRSAETCARRSSCRTPARRPPARAPRRRSAASAAPPAAAAERRRRQRARQTRAHSPEHLSRSRWSGWRSTARRPRLSITGRRSSRSEEPLGVLGPLKVATRRSRWPATRRRQASPCLPGRRRRRRRGRRRQAGRRSGRPGGTGGTGG